MVGVGWLQAVGREAVAAPGIHTTDQTAAGAKLGVGDGGCDDQLRYGDRNCDVGRGTCFVCQELGAQQIGKQGVEG
ncbi:hypothetical protein SDC9_209883 [bioreactor metagenome]|uniref:Uncharacterized protein n=1 Tax=bioreactor metagenome TaxID=1076179 RepID=A0A645JF82_9ZZZZ